MACHHLGLSVVPVTVLLVLFFFKPDEGRLWPRNNTRHSWYLITQTTLLYHFHFVRSSRPLLVSRQNWAAKLHCTNHTCSSFALKISESLQWWSLEVLSKTRLLWNTEILVSAYYFSSTGRLKHARVTQQHSRAGFAWKFNRNITNNI